MWNLIFFPLLLICSWKIRHRSLSTDYFGYQSYSEQTYPESIDNNSGKLNKSIYKRNFDPRYSSESVNHLHWIFSRPHTEYLNSEDEDYSFSLSRVLHRRASSRRKGYHSPRRTSASSQMAHISTMSGNSANVVKGDRRRSSGYTSSSGE